MKPITATYSENGSEERSDTYRLLNMIHVMAGDNANSPSRRVWQLKCNATYTDEGYYLTTWTNDVVDIEAISRNGVHTYTLRDAKVEE